MKTGVNRRFFHLTIDSPGGILNQYFLNLFLCKPCVAVPVFHAVQSIEIRLYGRTRDMMKKILASVIIITALFVIAFQIFFRLPLPGYNGTVMMQGLSAPVEVKTDRYGIPHIFAENERDLFFAQGFITARERMFQMDITRLAGRGELSSLFGEVTRDKDIFLKTVGFHRRARAGYRSLSAEGRQVIDSYTAGINQYLGTVKQLPREYIILGARPQPWAPEDCVATALLMSYSLTRSKKVDLAMYRVGETAGTDVLDRLLPSYPDFAPTLTGKRKSPKKRKTYRDIFQKFTAGDYMDKLLFPSDVTGFPASNWMIFSGRLTKSGKPLFSGSPDLKPTLPALFYIMHLKGGRYNVAGGNLPGTPGIGPLGYNGHIAWSAVNGRGDELDYFVEKLNPRNRDQYLTERGYRNFRIIEETLRIKTDAGIKEEKISVRISRHGPIISDVLPAAPKNCAMQWVALRRPCTEIDGLLLMNRAKNFSEFRNALSRILTMNLCLGYADRNGNIGWQFTASPPIRKRGDGSLPVPGWNGKYEWTGYVPFKRVPYDYNPVKGYTASFNNDPGNADYHLTRYYLFERAIRFREIMRQRGREKLSPDDIRKLQLDTVSVVAKRWVPLIQKACADIEDMKPYTSLFNGWEYSIDTGSSAATLFNTFYALMLKNTFQDEVGEKIWKEELSQSYLYYIPDLAVTKIIRQPHDILFDDRTTDDKIESRDDIIRKSMKEAVASLTERLGKNPRRWKWGKVHRMYFEHPLGSKLTFLNLRDFPTHGSHHTICSGFWEINNPYKMDAGGVIRMVIDFAEPGNSTIISPPGQSGQYMSRHYNDMAQMWADGKQVPINFTDTAGLKHSLMLVPDKPGIR